MKHTRIAIIGAGDVGSTTAYSLIMRNIATEILMVDANESYCKGQVADLSDTLSFSRASSIHQASFAQAASADIIIITAGARQQEGEPRESLLARNKNVIHSIITSLTPLNPQAIIIMVTNPVDILTHYAQQITPLPKNQIFGSGTFLDSIRLQQSIADFLHIAEESVHAYVLAEHGDSQFIAWSSAHVEGISLDHIPSFTAEKRQELEQKTRQKAYDIIACKRATYYGVACCIAAYCESIIFDQKKIFPLSCFIPEWNLCLSMPAVLGEKGITQIIIPSLNTHEEMLLKKSIQTIKEFTHVPHDDTR